MPEIVSSGQNTAVLVIWIGLYVVILGGVGVLIGRRNGQGALGFMLGVVLGPLGWVITFFLGRRSAAVE